MPVPGFVYVLSNAELPEFVKVGMTNELARRLVEIYTGAGVVGRWTAYGSVLSADMRMLEIKAHQALAGSRVAGSAGTEIFRCSAKVAAQAIVAQAASFSLKIYENNFPPEETQAEELARIAEQMRLKSTIEQICQRFPETIAIWITALELTQRRDASSSTRGAAVIVNDAAKRLSSISRSWGLSGHEEGLLQHVAAMHALRVDLSTISILAKAGSSDSVRQSTH